MELADNTKLKMISKQGSFTLGSNQNIIYITKNYTLFTSPNWTLLSNLGSCSAWHGKNQGFISILYQGNYCEHAATHVHLYVM